MRRLISPHHYRESGRQAAGSHRPGQQVALCLPGAHVRSCFSGDFSAQHEGHAQGRPQENKFVAKSKKGHECLCHYTARIQGGVFSGVPKKPQPPTSNSPDGAETHRGNNKHSHCLLNIHGVRGPGPVLFWLNCKSASVGVLHKMTMKQVPLEYPAASPLWASVLCLPDRDHVHLAGQNQDETAC